MTDITTGTSLADGRYQVKELVGQGAMGKVFLAEDSRLGRDLALKTLINPDPGFLLSLKSEFRGLADTSHPNLVRFHDLHADDEPYFITMDFVQGRELLEHIWDGPSFPGLTDDLVARAVDSFRQLAEALVGLHGSGHLHRDIKPSNVLVNNEGHLVLLDFGLTTATHYAQNTRTVGIGTPGFWAPEQIAGKPCAASDWFSFGVTLYRALTGNWIPPAIMVAPDEKDWECLNLVPETFRAPLRSWLATDPASRGNEEAFTQIEPVSLGRRSDLVQPTALVGRTAELEELRNTLATDRPAVTHISGPSGIGKTTLIRRFATNLTVDNFLVLRSKCRPNESVQFRALDSIIDELARELAHMPPQEGMSLVPRQRYVQPMLEQFPVLGTVSFFSNAEASAAGLEPKESQNRALQGLRELFERLSDRRQILFWIDDAQWGDTDSLAVLQELLNPPDAPPITMFLSYREVEESSAFIEGIVSLARDLSLSEHRLVLEPLSPESSEEMVASLLPANVSVSATNLERLLAEASGSPFLIGELARFISQHGALGNETTLTSSIEHRITQLPGPSRRIVETIATAGHTITLAQLDATSLDADLATMNDLVNLSWVQQHEDGGNIVYESYHDRIKDAVLALMPPDSVKRVSLELATTLAGDETSEPAIVMNHYINAEMPAEAVPFAIKAARVAEQRMAFDQAKRYYETALDILGDERTFELVSQYARTLAHAGHSELAAVTMESALAFPESEPAVNELRFFIAQEHLRGANVTAARQILKDLFPGHGLKLASPEYAEFFATCNRLLINAYTAIRGFKPIFNPEKRNAAFDIVTIASLGEFMDTVDNAQGDHIGTQTLRAAIFHGNDMEMMKVSLHESTKQAAMAGIFTNSSRRVLKTGVDLTRQSEYYKMLKPPTMWCIATTHYGLGRMKKCLFWWRHIEKSMLSQGGGNAYFLGYLDIMLTNPLSYLGHLEELGERGESGRESAMVREDLWSLSNYDTAVCPLPLIADDKAEIASSRLEHAISLITAEGVVSQHYYYVISAIKAALYLGDTDRAWELVEYRQYNASSAGIAARREILAYERARAALFNGGTHPKKASVMLRVAGREANSIRGSRLPQAAPLKTSINAAIASMKGDRSAAVELQLAAIRGFYEAEMPLYAEAHRLVLSDISDKAETSGPATWLANHGVRNPERFARCLAPPLVS